MSERRYFNLAPVVRDLEHGAGPDATAEGRDLWTRFCDIVTAAQEAAASLDADDEPEIADESDDLDVDDVGDALAKRGPTNGARPRRDAAGSDALQSILARLEGALAAQPGSTRSVPSGTPPLDGAGSVKRARKVGPRPKKRGGKRAAKTTKPKG